MKSYKKADIFAAIDASDFQQAQKLVNDISPHFSGIKLGLEFFMRFGTEGVQNIKRHAKDSDLFLDLKFHDIPNTVAKSIENILCTEPDFITIHASGGAEMIKAAAEAAQGTNTKILAVTVLTSLSEHDLQSFTTGNVRDTVLKLGLHAIENGASGLVCSPMEVAMLREELGPDVILVVPGIRPGGSLSNDQKRIMTPKQAFDAGASYLVIGRPVTKADNPRQAAAKICNDLKTSAKVA